ncbi:MAG: hypothetical protein FJX29_09960 [Alphaproteobacteria bacterium]|nr:hypothetical protein [Alphaproteobacteria bacterium]
MKIAAALRTAGLAGAALLMAGAAAQVQPAAAQSAPVQTAPAEGAFKGKTVTIMVGGTAGGGIDVGARMMARYLGPYLPGHPNIVVQTMPGAGGVRLMEYLNAVAPKDGTVIGAFATGPILEPLIGARPAKYRMTDYPAIGAIEQDVSFCTTWHASPVKTHEDARKRETTVAGTGAASSTDIFPVVLNAALGTRFRVITGYLGTQETIMAVERGETDGRCGWGWSSLKSSKPDWLRDKKLNFILQLGLEKHPEAPDVPLAIDLAEGDENKQMLRVIFAPLAITRPYFAPPGASAERVEELRAGFVNALKSPGAVGEFRKIFGEPPQPTPGQRMQKIIADVYATPSPVVARLKGILAAASKKN